MFTSWRHAWLLTLRKLDKIPLKPHPTKTSEAAECQESHLSRARLLQGYQPSLGIEKSTTNENSINCMNTTQE